MRCIPTILAAAMGVAFTLPAIALADSHHPSIASRVELTPTFETSINADYKHTVAGGLKAEFDLSDRWSIGSMAYFGTSFDTGLTTSILDTLEDEEPPGDQTPTRSEFSGGLTEIPRHGAGYVTLTPARGVFEAFGKPLVAYDLYVSGGVSVASLSNGDTRGAVGLYLAAGAHVFLNESLALDLSLRDYGFADNPSGFDTNTDRVITDDDDRFVHHWFAGLGLSLFFPT